jgi:hypothetical protein
MNTVLGLKVTMQARVKPVLDVQTKQSVLQVKLKKKTQLLKKYNKN